MAKIMTNSKPFKINKVLEILLETVQNPSLASKNIQHFKMKGGSSYVYHAEDSAKWLNWKSDLYRFGEFSVYYSIYRS